MSSSFLKFLTVSSLSLTVSLSLASCSSLVDSQIMPTGYQTNKENNHRPIFDVPTGYKFTNYIDHEQSRFKKDSGRPEFGAPDVIETDIGWSQLGLDLALAIDDEIGLETDQIAIVAHSDKANLKNALDFYLRQNLSDIEYRIKMPEEASYNIHLTIIPLETQSMFIPHQAADDMPFVGGQLNEGGQTAVYRYTPKNNRDVQVDTIILKDGKVLSKLRSTHRLSQELASQEN